MPIKMMLLLIVWLVGSVLSGRMAYVFSDYKETDMGRRRIKIFIAALLSWILVIIALIRFYISTKRYE